MKTFMSILLITIMGVSHAYDSLQNFVKYKENVIIENGLYWNPSESGRGYNIEYTGELIVIVMYGYTTDGFPIFYTMTGVNYTEGRFDDMLIYEYERGQGFGDRYQRPKSYNVGVGSYSPSALRDDQGVICWDFFKRAVQNCTVIERQRFNTP